MPKTGSKSSSKSAPQPARGMTVRTSVDLPADTRREMIELLNARLADFLDLERQCKQAHWNVRGPRFHNLHLLFDETAALAVRWADDIAERAMQLGGTAEGTVQVIAQRSSLKPSPLTAPDADAWIKVVTEAIAGCANNARKDIDTADEAGDAVTTDLLTRTVGEADKQLWFVESHLQNG